MKKATKLHEHRFMKLCRMISINIVWIHFVFEILHYFYMAESRARMLIMYIIIFF